MPSSARRRFNTHPSQVVGVIAGGYAALTSAVEGAEDRPELAVEDLKNVRLTDGDVLCGHRHERSHSLRDRQLGLRAKHWDIYNRCELQSRFEDCHAHAISDISVVVGPEIVSGSTRMKAGTATKMVLNMLSTGAMIRLGKTYGNLMVDLRARIPSLPIGPGGSCEP